MQVELPMPGSYVVAVSGGVDSMALLHLLQDRAANDNKWKLVVAHLDHGIREDSAEDRKLVQAVAKQYRLPFVHHEGRLGAGASEAEARQARYVFLRNVQQASGAKAIITAHHQDDLLETAILNILRGSGRKGLTALSDRHNMKRPLLGISKRELVTYAKDQGLQWREDSTNQNLAYQRNYIRHKLLSRFDESGRTKLLKVISALQAINFELDTLLVNKLHMQTVAGHIDRQWFNHLPHSVAREVLATWLRAHNVRDFDRTTLERLVVAAKTAVPGKSFPVIKDRILTVNTNDLALDRLER